MIAAPAVTQTQTFSGSLKRGNSSRSFGPSVLVLDATLAAGTYTYQVTGGRCSFTLKVTAPSE